MSSYADFAGNYTCDPCPLLANRRLDFYPDAYYVIVSLQEPDRPSVRAYRIIDGGVTEHLLHTAD